MEWMLLFITGVIAAVFGSMLGLGGGVIVVPGLFFLQEEIPPVSGITPQTAVGTSILIMIFTGLSSTSSYIKKGTADIKSGLIFFIGSGPGALTGVALNQLVTSGPFFILFGLFMIMISFVLMIRHKVKPLKRAETGIHRTWTAADGQRTEYGFQPASAIPLSFVIGMISGLFGVGGGALMVPAMIMLFAFPAHVAVATSMFMIVLSSLIGSAAHIALGNVAWLYASALIPGAYLGGKAGAFLNQRLTSGKLIVLFRLFLLVMAGKFIWDGWMML
ncbi:sulfite exporter TauE/SafE family protein [Salisediminibacterium halotolerans]|uniref:sulfite exporter TauE/SafE family protein n=1 Tax=Salisediminibacterium halotolerans TaxID=517425 RepID=UPI000EB18D31|nr:sulfite exporter TauE/SafE family protein [Salisediminibacterium halotolerans]RLJ75402.1 hypothetical protein BCL39_0916 [Actinophytocola xinjiangensis]RPE89256.1 hypothetical protein EDD67_0029 [Salisediminibacterium halotolerans]TWG36015.1 hypothetical protein BCL52_0914 [Salisediminibacterium halotolerans]GEL07809.1 UPF0721 transmembrane protein YunE [Salisediminibacterium halotolerans]